MPVTPDTLAALNAAVTTVTTASGDVTTAKDDLDVKTTAADAADAAKAAASTVFDSKHQTLVDAVTALEAAAEALK